MRPKVGDQGSSVMSHYLHFTQVDTEAHRGEETCWGSSSESLCTGKVTGIITPAKFAEYSYNRITPCVGKG